MKVYYYRHTTWLVDYPDITLTYYFMVEGLKDFNTPSSFPTSVVGDDAANDIEYTIGEPAVYVDFDIFKNDLKKDTEFYYEIRLANGAQIPSFMFFNETNMTLQIYAV